MGPDFDIIERDLLSNKLELFSINSELLAITEKIGDEFVVACVAGANLKNAIKALVKLGQKYKCKTIRFHAKRRGVYGLVKKMGLNPKRNGYDKNGYLIIIIKIGV